MYWWLVSVSWRSLCIFGRNLSSLIRQLGVDSESAGCFWSGRKRAVVQCGAFPHPHQTLAGIIGFGGPRAVVVNGYRNTRIPPAQGHGSYRSSTSVPGNIGQRFLDNSIQHELGAVGHLTAELAGFV